uniref:V-type proton ATPase subunit a n=1 Tax=Phaeomonas parva TaxID=124430 RepID=A0A7S1XVR6_9STRA|mmetsp:Transcript_41596/g.130346  ORF Transcript_41596/g.130346 Transcript_41596/m.130346 type:complete len:902 (+) Transcript_41596:196-2901(+)|eukprot:CAMPEP_0118884156 /NCGR_PEP_ID=MMETSP1163-20130328/23061_1 /TAXON_ID=124430 /ORGANISM="Phaeomonas parva, Strain CCMP2877" /LENGTH=901 /DNA_ID=CAMNT_0006821839 /DNA_START=162 /DNA_END=2867 /DNA_ORIENTATION=+
MGSWFRSEPMKYMSLIVHEDAAHAVVSALGRTGAVQFTDLNPEATPFQRRYVSAIKRCDELERKLRYFAAQVQEMGLTPQSAGSVDQFLRSSLFGPGRKDTAKSGSHLLETLEGDLEGHEGQLVELSEMSKRLTREYNEKLEYQEVLVKARSLFRDEGSQLIMVAESKSDESGPGSRKNSSSQPLLDADFQAEDVSSMRISFVAGILPQADKGRFERMLFRATRGNCYLRCLDVDTPMTDPRTGVSAHKVVFIVFYKSENVGEKIQRICDAFAANTYPVPDMDRTDDITAQLEDNFAELNDARVVLKHNHNTRYQLCLRLAQHLEEWTWIILKEKSTYHTLNMFKDDVRGCLRGEGWVVASQHDEAVAVANQAGASYGNASVALEEVHFVAATPPTHFKTNKFTYAYQEFVNTYGVPRYREINPALFTAVTFPYLFGIMYGDIGHGLFLFLAGVFLVARESAHEGQKLSEMMAGMHAARYMILMMGAFAVYAGLIYNDCFSLGLDLFGSKWDWGSDPEEGEEAQLKDGRSIGDEESVYPFGIDPAWHIADNELEFFNSIKMKMSVILGVIQMTFGVCLRTWNASNNKEWVDIIFECIPMFIFDLSFFGYMCLLIFIKWTINWDERMLEASCVCVLDEGASAPCSNTTGTYYAGGDTSRDVCDPETYDAADLCLQDMGGETGGCQPPNIIATLIGIVLQPGDVEEPMYAGQGGLQSALLLLMFMSVPVLLLAKPLILRHQHQAALGPRSDSQSSDTPLAARDEEAAHHGGHGGHGHGGEFEFGEIMIHQAIETIEFVLGMVSNTASYLRLWALSLAHTELATVFWEKAMLAGLASGNPVFIFAAYAVFAVVTFGVLLCMDVLECYLHALRLHWVEFQNKFFRADGYRFKPFDFKAVIKNADI